MKSWARGQITAGVGALAGVTAGADDSSPPSAATDRTIGSPRETSRLAVPARRRVDRARDQFLAHAGFARDQHGEVGRGDQLDVPPQPLHGHLSVMEYWRWWVVHLWVEGFMEVFATAAMAFILSRLGLVRATTATRSVLFSTAIFLVGGIPGTFHHLYFSGTPVSIMAVGATFSALEVVPLALGLMVAISLLPVGLVQTAASIDHGMWYARSAELLQQPLMQTLRWLRLIVDTIFLVGVGSLVWFVVGLKTGWSLVHVRRTEPGSVAPTIALIVPGSAGPANS